MVFRFGDAVLFWFHSYFENWTQTIVVHGKHSTPVPLTYVKTVFDMVQWLADMSILSLIWYNVRMTCRYCLWYGAMFSWLMSILSLIWYNVQMTCLLECSHLSSFSYVLAIACAFALRECLFVTLSCHVIPNQHSVRIIALKLLFWKWQMIYYLQWMMARSQCLCSIWHYWPWNFTTSSS